jgi:thiamine-phosphate diphosphorylase
MSLARDRLRSARVYAILTERFCRMPWRRAAEALVEGGVDALQLREKELPDGELLRRAQTLRQLTREGGVLFVVNDRPDVALLARADGVHLGQDDLPPEAVREMVGPDLVIGWSTHSLEQARRAARLPVDYVGVGPVHQTATKGYGEGKGLDLVQAACAAATVPTVAIGGMTAENAGRAIEAGATAVAACSALCGADDPADAARRFRAAVSEALARRKAEDG